MARQFTEEEAQRIFARAAERQHQAPTPAGGLTLDELQEIGAAAGLDPEHVAAAVAEAQVRPSPVPTWQGVPLRSNASRVVAGEVSEAAWMRMVDQMRATHQTPGVIERAEGRRVWRQYEGSLHGASLMVTPDPAGALLQVESVRGGEDAVTYVLSGLAGMMGGIGLIAYVVKDKPDGLVLMMLMAVFALAVAAAASVSVRRRARVTPGRMEALLDRLEGEVLHTAPMAASPEAEARAATPEASTRLDLDALDDEVELASRTESVRRRARS
ncbi:MAG: hypothetical protein AAF845_08400 [Bacteroidota bacterium]